MLHIQERHDHQVVCALYARVSTKDQTCDNQLRELRAYAERRGWQVYAEYADTAWTGKDTSRPAYTRLMKDADLHLFDCVVVWKLDRLGRSARQLHADLSRFAACDIRFLSITQGLDTHPDHPSRPYVIDMAACFAELESSQHAERIVAGMKRACLQGKHFGRPVAIFRRDKAIEFRRRGMSYRNIGRSLGVSEGTVYRFLKDLEREDDKTA